MKNSNSKTFVAVGIGAALFFVLGRFVAIPSPVPNTNISLQYAVLGLLAAMYGPVAGALASSAMPSSTCPGAASRGGAGSSPPHSPAWSSACLPRS